jgi:hypothetical protein
VEAAPIGDLSLKGFNRPIPAFEVLRWRGQTQAPDTSAGSPSGGPDTRAAQ